MRLIGGLISCLLAVSNIYAQKLSTEAYISLYSEMAVYEMKRSGVPASITLAQGILESSSGNSRLAIEGNNHFGIKCHDWDGEKMYHDDDAKGECFRVYRTAAQSFKDHSLFLSNRSRYAFLFDYGLDAEKWAYGLKQAGYATNPKYPQLLLDLIGRYNLRKFDGVNNGGSALAAVSENSTTERVRGREQTPVKVVKTERLDDVGPDVAVIRETYPLRILYTNGLKMAYKQPGETLDQLGKRLGYMGRKLRKYNEISGRYKLEPGMPIYLEKKRKKGDVDVHVVEDGDTWYKIGQLYGVTTSAILKKNLAVPNTVPVPGEEVWLRKKRDYPVAVMRQTNGAKPSKPKTLVERRVVNAPTKKKPESPKQRTISFNKPNTPSNIREEVSYGSRNGTNKSQPSAYGTTSTGTSASESTTGQSTQWKAPEESKHTTDWGRVSAAKVEEPVTNNSSTSNSNGASERTVRFITPDPSSFKQPTTTNGGTAAGNEAVFKPTPPPAKPIYHTVEKGQTLYRLSVIYQVSVDQIKTWNKLTSNDIAIGQRIQVGLQ